MPEIWSRGGGVGGSHLLESFLCQSINSTHQIRIISSSIEYILAKPNCLEENFLLSKKKKKKAKNHQQFVYRNSAPSKFSIDPWNKYSNRFSYPILLLLITPELS